ncbi:Ppm1l [Symbiodinium microadriaticum]|nr:Ppm1l [Symbiodinium microadriaticum]
MGAAGSTSKRYKPKAEESPSRGPWHLPHGGCVVSLVDFDPGSIRWPESWGVPLVLEKSMAIVVLKDDGGERAFGHYLAQPERRGFFLKHLTTVLEASRDKLKLTPAGREGADDVSTPAPVVKKLQPRPPSPSFPSTPSGPSSSALSTRAPDDSPEFLIWRSRPGVTETRPTAATRPSSNPVASAEARATGAQPEPVRTAERPKKRPEVLRAAEQIGLDLEKDEVLLWLAESAAVAALPEAWVTFGDDEGHPVYYHEKKKLVTRQHPAHARYKSFANRLRGLYQKMSETQALHGAGKIRAHLAVVLNEALNRCNRELPPVTPELLERAALLLGVDTSSEFALSTKVKMAMDWFVEEQYDISLATGVKADIDAFVAHLRHEQIQDMMSQPDGIIMCSELDGLPATVKCEECMDFFSMEGFARCHSSGKRRQHRPLKVEQCACSVFPQESATCEANGQFFSDRGYREAMKRNPSLGLKHCRFLEGIACSEYPDKRAEVLCKDCCDFFCIEAFWERHGHGHRQQHVQLAIDAENHLWRMGQKLPHEEASRILHRARRAREGGPWLAFRDDQLTSYWYHLHDKVEKGVGKPHMEDRLIIRNGIPVESVGAGCKKIVASLFGVFDGHSGASCSDFVATNLDRVVFECIRHQNKREVNSDLAMRSALQAAFRTTEHNFFQYANRLDAGPAAAWTNAGSTACTCTFYGPDEDGRLRLAVANAGDSRAVLGRKDCSALRLSEDHTPDVPGERKRIESEGAAVVQASGIWRIVLPSKKGTGLAGLSVSRGFGDIEYKTGTNVVSAVPDVFLSALDLREDCFVVIASDGVWGPVSDGEAVRIVAGALREGGEEPAAKAARQLLEIAHQRDGHDDKTVLVIWFGDLPLAPPAAASSDNRGLMLSAVTLSSCPGATQRLPTQCC